MTSENKTWENLRARYLREVEKALSSVKHPRIKEVLSDVRSHLDRRFAELEGDQQNWENFQTIITEMGPASDYAELLEPGAERPSRSALPKYVVGLGVAAVITFIVIILLTSISQPVGYIVSFKSVAPFEPGTPRELLNAFYNRHADGARTHHFRTEVQGNKLLGRICVDTEDEKDSLVKRLRENEKLVLVKARAVSQKALEKHFATGQPSLEGSVGTYIVVFKPVAPFAPQTARELLNAFNEKHPRGVRTHHYRTEVRDNALVGYICVDTKGGKDAVVSMLEESEKLELIQVNRASDEDLEKLYKKGQPSLKSRDTDKMAAEDLASDGWRLWRERKLAEAEKMFKKAVQKDPTNANAWNGLGWSQMNQGKALNAKASFEKCLEINPKHPAALNGLAWIAKGEGKTDEAISHWQKAIEVSPSATAALNGLATTYMELGQYNKAAEYYEMWLKVEPDNAQVKAELERLNRTGSGDGVMP
ncbi:MAG: tetratricopeptide repeat protein [Planctomycetota bacterium]|jgi:tetratricopeptide (TPR) repeat protein